MNKADQAILRGACIKHGRALALAESRKVCRCVCHNPASREIFDEPEHENCGLCMKYMGVALIVAAQWERTVVRAEVLTEACRAMCEFCNGDHEEYEAKPQPAADDANTWVHKRKGDTLQAGPQCDAETLWRMMAEERAKDDGK